MAIGMYDSMLNEGVTPQELAEVVKGNNVAEQALALAVGQLQEDGVTGAEDRINEPDSFRQEGYDAAMGEVSPQIQQMNAAHNAEKAQMADQLDAEKYRGQVAAQQAMQQGYKQGMLAKAKEDQMASSNTMMARDLIGGLQ